MDYNAVVREYSGQSLKVLARVLVADLKDYPADWKVRYCGKEIDKETTNIQELCCCPVNPLQIYKPIQNGFPVKVCTLEGKSFEVVASAKDTIKVLKLKIFQANPAYPPHVQNLRVNRNNREFHLFIDSFTVDRFAISSQSTVYLKMKSKAQETLQFGVKFKAINPEASHPRSASQLAFPKWAHFTAGFNFCGLCSNPDCASKELEVEREVVARSAFGEVKINFGRSGINEALSCTACSKKNPCSELANGLVELNDSNISNFQIVPTSYLIHNGRSVIFHKKTGEDKVRRIIFYSGINKGAEHKMMKAEKGLELLEITTVETWRSPLCCVRCDTKIMFKAHELLLACGHVYHTWCMPSILKGLKCKVCHAKILIVGKVGDVLKVT